MALTHVDDQGKANMVDITGKQATQRVAEATATVNMLPETAQAIKQNQVAKGDVLSTARIAGVMAAKRAAELIPLCHPLPLTQIKVEFGWHSETALSIRSLVKTTYQTGVEMEAFTAVAIAGLTIYDMCKAIDRGMTISDIKLVAKSGGKSGDFVRTKEG